MITELKDGKDIPQRRWATLGDVEVDGYDPNEGGHGPSPDAIGGYFGVEWQSYFRDAETNEVYQVRCTDGENGGKGAYSPEDEAMQMQMARQNLCAKSRVQADVVKHQTRGGIFGTSLGALLIAALESKGPRGQTA